MYLLKLHNYMYHFNTLDQGNSRAYISHIPVLFSFRNSVIGNGGSTFLCIPARRVYIFNVHSPFFISAYFISKQALMLNV